MNQTAVQRLARVLRVLVLAVFFLNLLVMPLVPGLSALLMEGGPEMVSAVFSAALDQLGRGEIDSAALPLFFGNALVAVWVVTRGGESAVALLTVFFWLCGTCTALILWQAKTVLDTILAGDPFQLANARALRRAAVCCWIISGAALVRLVLWLWAEGTSDPLFTYTALFVPAFFMGGLLFQVMSALFRQAAELKEDQDLTI